jgi:uncharacterized repeat protein (TIGR01451 family)
MLAIQLLVALGLVVAATGVLPLWVSQSASAAQTSCPTGIALGNGDFEAPAVGAGAGTNISDTNPAAVWQTTASDHQIEYWANGGNVQGANGGLPISAHDGRQWVELNANQPSTLYQDLATTPGQVMHWSLWHRARYVGIPNGQDVMRVLIGSTSAQTQQGANISDGPGAWGNTTGSYVVPAGQTTTRFAFQAVSSANGSPTFGNFLDDIEFSSSPCLSLTKSVTNLTPGGGGLARPGDVLEYTVTATNAGGDDANNSVVTDDIPANTSYVPGSLVVSGNAVTDATDGDTGEFSGGTVTGRIGAGATSSTGGNIAHNASTTVTFRVTVDPSAGVGTDITNEATATYQWNPSPTVLNATSNTTTHTVQIPGISLVKTVSGTTDVNGDGLLAAGDRVSYQYVVSNTGSTTLTAIAVADDKATVSCPSNFLAAGASETCTATYTVTQADVDNSPLVNTATATGTPPAGAAPIVSAQSTAIQALAQTASLRLVKHGTPIDNNRNGITDAGDTIQWTVQVTNTGLVTLTNVRVDDPKAGPITCPGTTLAPGQVMTCSADHVYLITAADVAAGGVHNTAAVAADCSCAANIVVAQVEATVATTKPPTVGGVGLPFTGANQVRGFLVWGVLAIISGIGLTLFGRRRA